LSLQPIAATVVAAAVACVNLKRFQKQRTEYYAAEKLTHWTVEMFATTERSMEIIRLKLSINWRKPPRFVGTVSYHFCDRRQTELMRTSSIWMKATLYMSKALPRTHVAKR